MTFCEVINFDYLVKSLFAILQGGHAIGVIPRQWFGKLTIPSFVEGAK